MLVLDKYFTYVHTYVLLVQLTTRPAFTHIENTSFSNLIQTWLLSFSVSVRKGIPPPSARNTCKLLQD
jgi:hypothetical protein